MGAINEIRDGGEPLMCRVTSASETAFAFGAAAAGQTFGCLDVVWGYANVCCLLYGCMVTTAGVGVRS